MMMIAFLNRMFPFLTWLPELKQWSTLRADIIAGLTVAMLIIPQSMAYAHLAGLPVYMGLYSAFIPPMVGALFSSSRYLSTGPVPVTSLLTAVAMMPMASIGTADYLQYVVLLTLMSGMIQVALGLMRFGVVVHFISFPVLLGFINGVAVIIASMQLSSLFGVNAVTYSHYYETIWQVFCDALVSMHGSTVAMAAVAFLIILGGRRFWPKLPHILIAVVVTTLLSYWFHYEKLETILPQQLANLPLQQTLKSYQQFSEKKAVLSNEIKKSDQALRAMRLHHGERSSSFEDELNHNRQAKWELERLMMRHNIEGSELKRLRLRRLVTKEGQIVFFVNSEMSPIGDAGSDLWRMLDIPNDDSKITLHAGGEVVGVIPLGLPSFQTVAWSWDALSRLFMSALLIALVGFTEAITIAKHIAAKGRQSIHTNQELLSQGLAKCVGSFFHSMPVSGSFTRSALNYTVGAKTGFSSIILGLVVMMVLAWCTSFFYYLPYATLAAIIILGMIKLIDLKEVIRIWHISYKEGMVSILTFILTLFLAPSLPYALILGMLLSLGVYLYETMRPRFNELVRVDTRQFSEIGQEEVYPRCSLVSLVRFGGSLYFANVSYFESHLLRLINKNKKLRYILLDCVSINKLDATGLETLFTLFLRLEELGIQLCFSRVRAQVFDVLKRGGMIEKLGAHHFYKNNEQALEQILSSLGEDHTHQCHLRT